MTYAASDYSHLQRKQITKGFSEPVDAICAALEIMGESDKNAGVIGPDRRFYNWHTWDSLWYPKAYAASL